MFVLETTGWKIIVKIIVVEEAHVNLSGTWLKQIILFDEDNSLSTEIANFLHMKIMT